MKVERTSMNLRYNEVAQLVNMKIQAFDGFENVRTMSSHMHTHIYIYLYLYLYIIILYAKRKKN